MNMGELPSIGLGCASFGGIFGEVDNDECLRTIRTAYDLGVKYFDTAPWYGGGRSEQTLGEAISCLPRSDIFISTKVCRYKGPKMFDFSKKSVETSLRRSLKLLRTDYVDLLLVHDVEFALNPEVIANDVLPALKELKQLGLIKFIGISGYDLDFILRVVNISTTCIDYVLSYARLTLFDTSYKEYITKFTEHKVHVILASMTGMGLLTEAGAPFWHPASEQIKNLCEQIKEYCKLNGLCTPQVCHAFAYEPGIAKSLLLGAKNVSELKENMEAFGVAFEGLRKEALHIRKSIVRNINYNWLNVEVAKYIKKKERKEN